MFEVVQRQRVGGGIEVDVEFAAIDDAAVVIAEHRQHHLAASVRIAVPIDVEEMTVGRERTPGEDVVPPRVIGADTHVVRNEVDQMAHPARVQRADHRTMLALVPDLGVEARVVDHIVAVLAPRSRAKIGRCIEMADPERVEIRHDPLAVGEVESRAELDAVRGKRNGGEGHVRDQRTAQAGARPAGWTASCVA